MHVTGYRRVCVGAGQCILAAPDVFDQDDDKGLVLVLQQNTDSPGNDGPMTFSVRAAEHTGITVNDLERALAFWHGLLGMEVLYRSEIAGEFASGVTGVEGADIRIAVVEVPGGHRIELLECRGPAERAQYAPRPCDVGSLHVALTVHGIDELVELAAELGWEIADTIQRRPNEPRAGSRFCYLHDPDGTTVELVEPA